MNTLATLLSTAFVRSSHHAVMPPGVCPRSRPALTGILCDWPASFRPRPSVAAGLAALLVQDEPFESHGVGCCCVVALANALGWSGAE